MLQENSRGLKVCRLTHSLLQTPPPRFYSYWVTQKKVWCSSYQYFTGLWEFTFSADFSVFCCQNLCVFFYFQPKIGIFTSILHCFSVFLVIFRVFCLWPLTSLILRMVTHNIFDICDICRHNKCILLSNCVWNFNCICQT